MFKHFILGAAMLLAVGASAQTQPAADATPKATSPVVQQIQLAGQLVKYGYENKNALSLLQAAQLYQSLNVSSTAEGLAKQPEAATPETTSSSLTKTNIVSHEVAQLLADATTYANGNKSMLALIKDASKTTQSPTVGTFYRTSRVRAGYTDTWTVRFRGGEDACVMVSGDGDTDLDLYIYDENNNLIDSDTDRSDDCVCTFRPRWTGTFYIKIKNLGRVYNQYELLAF